MTYQLIKPALKPTTGTQTEMFNYRCTGPDC